MEEVLCWCCEYFLLLENEPSGVTKTRVFGTCGLTDRKITGYDKVCEDFLINSGLHTNRNIPDYCKNYRP